MEISIKASGFSRDILSLYLDEDKKKDIHIAVYGRNPSFPKFQANDSWEDWFRKIEYAKVKNYVLRRLSAQSYHSNALRKLLKERFVSQEIAERVIQEFIEHGFIDDHAWVKSFVKRYRKKMSLSLLAQKLQNKGFCWEEINEIKCLYENKEEEINSLKTLLSTKFRNKDLDDFKVKQKVFASLMRKGFSYELIKSCLEIE